MCAFTDVVVCLTPEITVSYRSGMMVYEEGLRDGRWVSLSYSANGHLMATNNRPEPSFMEIQKFAKPEAFRLNVDGQELASHWSWGGVEVSRQDDAVDARVTLIHQIRPVTVCVKTHLDGTAVLTRSITVRNTGGNPSALVSVSPLSGGVQQTGMQTNRLAVTDQMYRVGYMKGSIWASEGEFRWETLPDEIYTVCGRYRRDRYRHPMFMLENRLTGEMFICQLAWSGGYAFSFDFNREHPDTAQLAFDIALDAPAPMRMLAAEETYESPSVHIGVVFGGLDPAVQQMHDHIRKSVFLPPTRGISGWVEAGIGPEYDMDRESTLKAIENATNFGAEVFFIDAGWYLAPDRENDWWKFTGDWRFHPQRYPNGIGEMCEAAKSKGLLFGLWMDADRIGPASKVWQEHEDWVATNYNGKQSRAGLLNLAVHEITAWMDRQIRFLLDEYKLDMFRLDYNVGTADAVAFNAKDGYLENTFARYYENVYRVYRKLREDYPDVIFESCAGGGGRTDLGMTQNFTHTWVTDWQIHPRAFSITNGMTMALPPECVDRLIGGQNAYRTADMNTLMRNLLFARPTIGGFKPPYAEANPAQLETVRHNIQLYKSFVRPMHRRSLLFHHTPELEDSLRGFGILEMADRDASQGMLGVFRLAEPEQSETLVTLRGVDISADYEVTFDNTRRTCRMSGVQLSQQGIRVRLDGALTSELVLYRRV